MNKINTSHFIDICFHVFSKYLGIELTGHTVKYIYKKLPNYFPKWLYHTTPTAKVCPCQNLV